MAFAPVMQLVGRSPRITLALYSLLLASIGLASFPPVDRDEAYFAQSARQMLESGNYVDIRFQDAPRYRKPILVYWLEAASAAVAGGPRHDRIAAYRAPSALATVVATLALYEIGLALFGGEIALGGAALFASTLLLQTQAHQARADAVLLATIVLCMWPLARAWRHATAAAPEVTARVAALFWISLGAGVLTKGPVAPAVVGLTIAALAISRRDARWLTQLRPAIGVLLLVLVIAPWPLAMLATHGSGFFVHAWQSDVWPKLVTGQESHGAPPLYYVLLLPLVFWPATLALPGAARHAWRMRAQSSVRFCVAWLLPAWLMFELIPTKLPHYVLPLLPALALLAAHALHEEDPRAQRIGWPAASLFLLASACLAGASVIALHRYGSGVSGAALSGLIVFGSVIGAATVAGLSRRPAVRWASLLACAIVANVWLYALVAPRLDRLWIVARAADVVRQLEVPENCSIAVTGYREPSVVFLLGTATQFMAPSEAAQRLAAVPGSVALVRSDLATDLLASIPGGAPRPALRATIAGTDPVHLRPVSIDVWTAACGSPRRTDLPSCCPAVPGQ